ncbi:MAG: hypothetical protein AB7I27_16845 [Bacteriovoracaceae bacterium]
MKKILAFIIFLSSSVHAGVLIEPVAGYSVGGKFDISDGKNYTGTGASYGGRLGYQNLGFQLGLDYLHSSIDLGSDDFDSNLSLDEFGGFVGFEFPILLRAYAGYTFSASGKTKYDNGTTGMKDTEFKKGAGPKFGIGFTGLPFLVINLEYRSGKFSEYEIDGTKQEGDITYSSYLVSVSLPITL